jgi:dolichol-phosphate mannosyltransferase
VVSDYEIIVVENGSRDRSWEILQELHRGDARLKAIRLSRNFGYQTAVTAGLHFSRGRSVAVMDGDLQDPPEFLPTLYARQQEGFEVVYGIRAAREETLFRRLAFKVFYRLLRLTANVRVPLDAGDFCVMDRRVVEALCSMPERSRFLRGLRAWSGFRQTGLPYRRPARAQERSKFGLGGMLSLAMDGLVGFSMVPLRLITITGVASSVLALLGIVVSVVLKIISPSLFLPGFTQLNAVILLIGGFLFLALGLLGEYVGRIYEEVKGRPLYLIFQTCGMDPCRDENTENPGRAV